MLSGNMPAINMAAKLVALFLAHLLRRADCCRDSVTQRCSYADVVIYFLARRGRGGGFSAIKADFSTAGPLFSGDVHSLLQSAAPIGAYKMMTAICPTRYRVLKMGIGDAEAFIGARRYRGRIDEEMQ